MTALSRVQEAFAQKIQFCLGIVATAIAEAEVDVESMLSGSARNRKQLGNRPEPHIAELAPTNHENTSQSWRHLRAADC